MERHKQSHANTFALWTIGAAICHAHSFRLLLVGLLVSCACSATSDPMSKTDRFAEQKDNMSMRAAVDAFGRLAGADQIDRVSVKYVRWEVERSVRISEHTLMTSDYPLDWEITAHREMARQAAMKLVDAFDKHQLERKEIAASELDFGLGVAFYAHGKQVLQMCVSKYPPAISINGEFFDASPHLVYPLTTLLPVEAHRGMFFYTIDEWASPPYKETIGGFRRAPGENDPKTIIEQIKQGTVPPRPGNKQREDEGSR